MRIGGWLSFFWFDCLEFWRRHLGRFVSFFVLFLLGVVVGIWYGVVACGNAVVVLGFDGRVVGVLVRSCSFFGYLFALVFECLVVLGLILLLSLHYYATLLNYLIFAYRGYLIAFNTVMLFCLAQLSCLPFVLICYVPLAVVSAFCLICFAVKSIEVSYHGFATRCTPRVTETLASCYPILAILLVLMILETILTFALTSGIVI